VNSPVNHCLDGSSLPFFSKDSAAANANDAPKISKPHSDRGGTPCGGVGDGLAMSYKAEKSVYPAKSLPDRMLADALRLCGEQAAPLAVWQNLDGRAGWNLRVPAYREAHQTARERSHQWFDPRRIEQTKANRNPERKQCDQALHPQMTRGSRDPFGNRLRVRKPAHILMHAVFVLLSPTTIKCDRWAWFVSPTPIVTNVTARHNSIRPVIAGTPAGGEGIDKEKDEDARPPSESVTVIPNGNTPPTVGMPPITPDCGLRLNPGGKDPDVIEKVWGCNPSVATTVAE